MDPTEDLARWECAGGHWQVVARDADSVTVALLTCDGGEEMSRMTAPAVALEGSWRDAPGAPGSEAACCPDDCCCSAPPPGDAGRPPG